MHTRLEKRRPDLNQMRFYTLTMAPNLFGEWGLVREWGRIGKRGQHITECYRTRDEAFGALVKRTVEKTKRGYQIKTNRRQRRFDQ